ncbi:rab9 effector protein with kelch motifs-like [Coregonus clupeaformis]|uniref:rab9 effector protein with kelch motifs-like n=1 Tax=Coregonus clupeaformis TaxID=59861 RepID=UPI001BE0530C|nr:rab9 effector protein with kelch motifs-like [Coregonus clupeaformis]
MAGEKFHSNMYSLDTSSMKWEKVKAKGDIPPGVAAPSAVALGKNIYIFGGVTSEGDSNAMYRLQCDEAKNIYFGMWSYFETKGTGPCGGLKGT